MGLVSMGLIHMIGDLNPNSKNTSLKMGMMACWGDADRRVFETHRTPSLV